MAMQKDEFTEVCRRNYNGSVQKKLEKLKKKKTLD